MLWSKTFPNISRLLSCITDYFYNKIPPYLIGAMLKYILRYIVVIHKIFRSYFLIENTVRYKSFSDKNYFLFKKIIF